MEIHSSSYPAMNLECFGIAKAVFVIVSFQYKRCSRSAPVSGGGASFPRMLVYMRMEVENEKEA